MKTLNKQATVTTLNKCLIVTIDGVDHYIHQRNIFTAEGLQHELKKHIFCNNGLDEVYDKPNHKIYQNSKFKKYIDKLNKVINSLSTHDFTKILKDINKEEVEQINYAFDRSFDLDESKFNSINKKVNTIMNTDIDDEIFDEL